TRGVYLGLLRPSLIFNIVVERAGQGTAKARQMGSTIPLRNIIGVTKNIFLVAIIPLQGNLYAHATFVLRAKVKHPVYRGFIGVQVGHKSAEPAAVLEYIFFSAAFIPQDDADTGIKEA